MPPQATLDLYAATQRRSLAAVLAVRSLWSRIRPSEDWRADWGRQIPSAVAVIGAAQVGAAIDGSSSVPASLRQAGFPESPLASVAPAAFGGWVESDQGFAVPLDKALMYPVIHARQAGGASGDQLQAGLRMLETLAQTAVADAARSAVYTQAVSTPNTVAAWYEPPPYCQRCAILIGKRVKPTTQFARHPQCDGQVEILSARDHRALPDVSVDEISDLTDAQKRAVELGGDLGQVVNAYRGGRMSAKWTSEGTTRRGWASYVDRAIAQQRGAVARETAVNVGRRGAVARETAVNVGRRGAVSNYTVRRTGPRPTPGAIFDYADRHGLPTEETVRILHRTGYVVVGDLGDMARLAS